MQISSTLKLTDRRIPKDAYNHIHTQEIAPQRPQEWVTLSGQAEEQTFYRAKAYTLGALAGMAVGTLPVLLSEQTPLAGFAAVIAGSAVVGSMSGHNTDQKIGLGIASTVVGLSSMVAAELALGKGAGLLAPAIGLFIAHAASSTD